eukprot:2221698-Rhodomonas_salina.1
MPGFGAEEEASAQHGGVVTADGATQELVGEDGAVWHGVDAEKARAKFAHYDTDNSGTLDSGEVVKLSVDLFQAFHPGKELTPEQASAPPRERCNVLAADAGSGGADAGMCVGDAEL